MTRVAELMGHTERVLQTCLSPDTSTLVSAGADETLRYGLVVVVVFAVVVVVIVVVVVVFVRLIGNHHWTSSYQSLSVYSDKTIGSVTMLVICKLSPTERCYKRTRTRFSCCPR